MQKVVLELNRMEFETPKMVFQFSIRSKILESDELFCQPQNQLNPSHNSSSAFPKLQTITLIQDAFQ